MLLVFLIANHQLKTRVAYLFVRVCVCTKQTQLTIHCSIFIYSHSAVVGHSSNNSPTTDVENGKSTNHHNLPKCPNTHHFHGISIQLKRCSLLYIQKPMH